MRRNLLNKFTQRGWRAFSGSSKSVLSPVATLLRTPTLMGIRGKLVGYLLSTVPNAATSPIVKYFPLLANGQNSRTTLSLPKFDVLSSAGLLLLGRYLFAAAVSFLLTLYILRVWLPQLYTYLVTVQYVFACAYFAPVYVFNLVLSSVFIASYCLLFYPVQLIYGLIDLIGLPPLTWALLALCPLLCFGGFFVVSSLIPRLPNLSPALLTAGYVFCATILVYASLAHTVTCLAAFAGFLIPQVFKPTRHNHYQGGALVFGNFSAGIASIVSKYYSLNGGRPSHQARGAMRATGMLTYGMGSNVVSPLQQCANRQQAFSTLLSYKATYALLSSNFSLRTFTLNPTSQSHNTELGYALPAMQFTNAASLLQTYTVMPYHVLPRGLAAVGFLASPRTVVPNHVAQTAAIRAASYSFANLQSNSLLNINFLRRIGGSGLPISAFGTTPGFAINSDIFFNYAQVSRPSSALANLAHALPHSRISNAPTDSLLQFCGSATSLHYGLSSTSAATVPASSNAWCLLSQDSSIEDLFTLL